MARARVPVERGWYGRDGVCRAGAHIPRQYPPLVSSSGPALTARPQSSLLSAGSNNTRYTTPATTTHYTIHYSPLQTHQNLLPNVISSILSEDKSGELTLDSVYGMFECVMTINSDKRSEWRVTPFTQLPLAVPPRTHGQVDKRQILLSRLEAAE